MRAHSPKIPECSDRIDSAYAGSRRGGSVTFRTRARNRFFFRKVKPTATAKINAHRPSMAQCFGAVSTERHQREPWMPFLEPRHSRRQGRGEGHPSPWKLHLQRSLEDSGRKIRPVPAWHVNEYAMTEKYCQSTEHTQSVSAHR